jgi:ABC-type Fe3+-hydroxamate transport system substrate-binding protein
MRRLLPFLLLLTLAGCKPAQPVVGGELPKKVYWRIVSLSPSTTDLIGLLRADDLLVGRTSADTSPYSVARVPIVANPRPDIEMIVKIQPDLVIVDANLINPVDLEKLKAQKFDVVPLEIHSVKDWVAAVWKLGALVNQHSAASKEVDQVEMMVRNLSNDIPNPKPRVIVAMGGDKPWVAGTESFQADVVRCAGGEPIGPPGNKFAQVNPEQVLAWNPDMALVSDAASSYTGPAWAATKAGKSGHVFEVKPDLLLRPGSRVKDLLEAVGRVLRNPGGSQ